MQNIEHRITSVENQNRWLKCGLGSILCLLCLIVTVGAADKKKKAGDEAPMLDEVRAKRIVLIDDEGHERIVMEVAEKKLNNEIKSDKRKEVFTTVRINDSEGIERLSLDASDGGLARIKVFNSEGKRRVEIYTAGEEGARMIVYDKNGKEEMNKFP